MIRITAAPPAADAKPAGRTPATEGIAKAARDFTAIAYTELLAPMFATIDTSDGPFGGGGGERAFQPMWIAEIAKHMAADDARGGGLNLTASVAAQMQRMATSRKDHKT